MNYAPDYASPKRCQRCDKLLRSTFNQQYVVCRTLKPQSRSHTPTPSGHGHGAQPPRCGQIRRHEIMKNGGKCKLYDRNRKYDLSSQKDRERQRGPTLNGKPRQQPIAASSYPIRHHRGAPGVSCFSFLCWRVTWREIDDWITFTRGINLAGYR